MTRRLALTALAVLASFAFASACTQGTPGSTASATPTKTAADILTEAADATKSESFKYTIDYGDTIKGEGTVDGTAQNSQSTTTMNVAAAGVTLKIDALIVAGDIFVKLDLGPLGAAIPGMANIGDKWMHIDRSKVGANGLVQQFTPGQDSVGSSGFVKGIVTAEKVSDTEIKGTIDLTKSAPTVLRPEQISGFGEEGKKVPFTATLDGQGRITKLVLNMPKTGTVPATDLTTTYSDFGTTVTVAKPAAAEVVEAPDLVYTFLQ